MFIYALRSHLLLHLTLEAEMVLVSLIYYYPETKSN